MKAGLPGWQVVLFLATVTAALAQESAPQGTNAPPAELPKLQYDIRAPIETPASESAAVQEVIRTKNLEVGGPLIQPLKAKRVPEGMKRFVQLFNPFAPAAPDPEIKRVGKFNSLSWAMTVGVTPGRSAFPEETTSPPTLTLLTVSAPSR